MSEQHMGKIRRSFAVQAEGFEGGGMSFSKAEYLDYTVRCTAPCASDRVLEVAAGTCACGRALAATAGEVTCLDATPEMLSVGQREAERLGLRNMRFVEGSAYCLPFPARRFDIVLSRLAFHHFDNVPLAFAEMLRVLRPGGKLVLIDMEAAEEALRTREDMLETMRDPSHVRNLSRDEICGLFEHGGLELTLCEGTEIPVSLQNWMALTKTGEPLQREIAAAMEQELQGGEKTGFAPYRTEEGIFFRQRWLMVIGRKNAASCRKE